MKEQIIELQMLLMDQQHSIDGISESLSGYTGRFADIEKKLEQLEQKLREILELGESVDHPTDERPPHY